MSLERVSALEEELTAANQEVRAWHHSNFYHYLMFGPIKDVGHHGRCNQAARYQNEHLLRV